LTKSSTTALTSVSASPSQIEHFDIVRQLFQYSIADTFAKAVPNYDIAQGLRARKYGGGRWR